MSFNTRSRLRHVETRMFGKVGNEDWKMGINEKCLSREISQGVSFPVLLANRATNLDIRLVLVS